MAKLKTSSYTLTLKLKTSKSDIVALDKYFELSRKLYNALLGEGLIRFQLMRESKLYQNARKETNKKFKTEQFKQAQTYWKFSKFDLNKYSTSLRVNEFKDIDANTVQALSARVIFAIDKMRFGNAKKVNFIKYGEMYSIEGLTNRQGITYRGGIINFRKLRLPIIIRPNDVYAQRAIQDRVKYCRIVKKLIRGKNKYYVQLILEGTPPVKVSKDGEIKNSIVLGDVGIDIGTRTIAISSKSDVNLLELCPEVDNIEHKKLILSRKLDRQRRYNNPSKYNEDGTINISNRDKWIKSNNYTKTQDKLREIQRKQATIRKQSHEILANKIISQGDRILVETMNFKGLQRRSKNTTVNKKTGKFNKKKRFGKSLGSKAPAMLIEIINRKLKYEGLEILKVNTYKVKASQYNHFSDEYNKKELKDRWNNDIEIQRDCYSAFLIMNVDDNLETINRDKCFKTYDNFKKLHDEEISRLKNLKQNGIKIISSMGI